MLTVRFDPRSTCSQRSATLVQNLSDRPPETEPLTAFSGPSVVAQGVLLVAGRLSARLTGEDAGAIVRASSTIALTYGTPAASTANSM